jgi:uncharacterized protein YlxW (UPF0749 family)
MDIFGPSGHWLARVEYHDRNSVYLMADAPLLLAEVKRLRKENRSLFLRLSDLQGQVNALHRGEQE